ncbi:MAG: sensor histidine kinase [Phycisphaeraceae bacterium]
MALVLLTVVVLLGYLLIALEWRRHEVGLLSGVRRRALRRMRYTLVSGAVVGYGFIPVAMVWPGWRLYALALVLTGLLVWRLAWTRRDVKVLCRAVTRPRNTGRAQAAHAHAEVQRRSFFLNALGHDLKNPLHGVTLQAQVAETCLSSNDPDGVRRALRLMHRCTDEANALLNNFLDLGRLDCQPDAPVMAAFDAAEVLRGVAESNRVVAEQKGLALEEEIPPELPVLSDREKLERIAQNLLSNAIKYTNTGKVLIRGGVEGRSLILEVEDTGPGIPPEAQEHLFDAFYRADHPGVAQQSGYGLGLAIVDRLVRCLDGRVELDSAPGQGTRFRVSLPAAVCEPAT